MGKPVKTYDLKAVYLTVGGYRIGGYGESGGIEIAWSSDLVEATTGADGESVVSRSNNHSATATITVMETSKSYKDLAALLRAQESQEAIERLEFLLEDEINGDKVSDQYAVFLALPTVSKQKKAGEREFKLFLPNAGNRAKFGAKLTI